MITLKRVTESERELLYNINQKFLYEMTRYYPDDMDEHGNYHYGNFDAYFTEADQFETRNKGTVTGGARDPAAAECFPAKKGYTERI